MTNPELCYYCHRNPSFANLDGRSVCHDYRCLREHDARDRRPPGSCEHLFENSTVLALLMVAFVSGFLIGAVIMVAMKG